MKNMPNKHDALIEESFVKVINSLCRTKIKTF